MNMEGKVVLVTGASRGIGASIATAFAREGALVIINYLQNHAAAESVAKECTELGGEGWAIQADVTDEEQVAKMVQQVILEAGTIDVLVHNAFKSYIFDVENRRPAGELSWEHYLQQIDGSLRSAYLMSQAVIPHMKKQCKGSIINMTTNLVDRPIVPYHDYTTAKAALTGFSKNLAADLGRFGIRVNCVAPGLVYPTDTTKHTKEDVKNMIISQTPLRRLARPADLAGPVLFLASDWSEFITGQTITVDGGFVM
ncbi:SDR family oxidoreductase [Cytobacillus gottheilii]|uniref:SDR family oxidoreductase n=1 Tax=Cytobacillus gottheilii TaxID=859144 RepID=UPI0009BA5C8B|nr:SDR family oxidoreductase [Cytobacillus gottheilii]